MENPLIKILIPATLAFVIGILITPLLTHYLFKYKVWKKTGGKEAIGGNAAIEFNKLKGEHETKTPRMGGIIIWGSVILTVLLLMSLKFLFPETPLAHLDFFSREQTWIPISVLIIGALVGLINDFYDVTHGGKGLRLSIRI
ncbi:MAG: phospho-N-acetylmuramoyl-pentapeptide-transferase, phospho-N-acetylmuramoyl-pentapeptide-transferase, partial [Candidatus Parcubacteria bacterium]